MSDFKVYVGTYGKYNEGNLKGKWLDLTDFSDKDEFIEECMKLHFDEDDPEIMFQDWEGIPKEYISESYIDAAFWDDFLPMIGNADPDAVKAFLEDGHDISNFEDAYQGEWNSEEDFAYEIFTESTEIPDNLINYIDWEKVARDLFIDDYFSVDAGGGKVFIFSRNY